MDIINKTIHTRLLMAVFLLGMLALPLSAQEQADSVFTFRFLSGKNMFYAPGLNNGPELTRLFDCVEQFKDKIAAREISLRVDGYYIADGSKAEIYKTAKTRSNRVKSELITRRGLKEINFITRNQPGQSNYVTVRLFDNLKNDIFAPAPTFSLAATPVVAPAEPQPESAEAEPATVTETEPTEVIVGTYQVIEPEPAAAEAVQPEVKTDSRLALKTNLLDYAILMPNAEIEWAFADRWSAAFEIQTAWYGRHWPHKAYRIGTAIPELRYWAASRGRWHGMYVGVFAGVGLYDLSNHTKGHRGEGVLGGLSIGYMWPISRRLSLDAGIGAGYMYARDKVYAPYDGHFLYQYTKNINYFGPLRLKLSLVWRLQK